MFFKWMVPFLFTAAVFAQQRTIDSINQIPFEVKIAGATNLERVFLENAKKAQAIEYEKGLAESYSNLALIYYYRGKYEQSVKYRVLAIELYQKLGLAEALANEYGELGYSMKRRNMKKAQEFMQKGLLLASRENLLHAKQKLFDNYGVLKEMQGQLDSALFFYRRGLAIKEQIGDSIAIPYSLSNVAGIFAMRGDYARAIPLYQRSLAIREAKQDQLGITENLLHFGDLHQAQKKYQEAIGYYSQALELSRRHNYLFGMQTCHRKLAQCHEKLNNTFEALSHYKMFVQFKDSINNIETNKRIAELEVRFDTNEKEKKLIEKQADVEQRNMLLLILAIISLSTALIGYLIYRQQKMRNRQMAQQHELRTAIAHIETQNKLQEQRLAISRDLHDNIGAQLTFIISSVDNTRYAFETENTPMGAKLKSIAQFARETIIELRDTIWAMNHSEITLEELAARISNFFEKAAESGCDAHFDLWLDPRAKEVVLTSTEGMNLYRTIQEAVHNAVKYSSAKNITVTIASGDTGLQVGIRDDGNGFDIEATRPGNGLGNMRKRMEAMGATLEISSADASGTQISIHWPRPKNATL